MKKILKKKIVRYKFLVQIMNSLFRIMNKGNYLDSLDQSNKASMFDLEFLKKPFPYYPLDFVFDNHMYGITHSIKKFAAISSNYPLNCYIEHGVFLGDHVQDDQFDWFCSQTVTFSDTRKEHLRNRGYKKTINPLGPYILYAENFYLKEKLVELRNQNGKTLLVFPPHSTKNLNFDYSSNKFIEYIEKIKRENRFQTVLICLYWLDLYNVKIINGYNKLGYKIVSAGHKFDPNFLRRLRTIIEISDFTISNSVGTHVGYCVALNRPHFIIDTGISISAKNNVGKELIKKKNTSREKEMLEIKVIFSSFQKEITMEQKNVVRKYWGNLDGLSSEALRKSLLK